MYMYVDVYTTEGHATFFFVRLRHFFFISIARCHWTPSSSGRLGWAPPVQSAVIEATSNHKQTAMGPCGPTRGETDESE